MKWSIEDESRTVALAQKIAPLLRAGDLLILEGGLGAGKTFFTRALCHALGLDEDEAVTSPTYSLVHEIPTSPPLLHVDLYRLSSTEEVLDLGLDLRREEGQLLVVEWGAPHVAALGGDALYLELSVDPREALLYGESARAAQVLDSLSSSLQ